MIFERLDIRINSLLLSMHKSRYAHSKRACPRFGHEPGRGLFAVMLGASVERQAVGSGSSPTHKEGRGSEFGRVGLDDSAVTARVYQTIGTKHECYASYRKMNIRRWSNVRSSRQASGGWHVGPGRSGGGDRMERSGLSLCRMVWRKRAECLGVWASAVQ